MDINSETLSGLKFNLVCCFKLTVEMVGNGVRESVYGADRPSILKRELVGFGMDGYH